MKAQPKKCRLHVYVSPAAAAAVRLRAVQRNLTISDVIEEAIFDGPPLPSIPAPMALWRTSYVPTTPLFVQPPWFGKRGDGR